MISNHERSFSSTCLSVVKFNSFLILPYWRSPNGKPELLEFQRQFTTIFDRKSGLLGSCPLHAFEVLFAIADWGKTNNFGKNGVEMMNTGISD